MQSEAATIAAKQRPVSRPEAALAQPDVLEGEVLEGEVLDKDFEIGPEQPPIPPSPLIDIGAVINKALKAAGLR
jgi:hypothetical protein